MSYADDFINHLKEVYSDENMKAFWNADKMFFNEGVDACIAIVKDDLSKPVFYHEELYSKLEQLKKPIQ